MGSGKIWKRKGEWIQMSVWESQWQWGRVQGHEGWDCVSAGVTEAVRVWEENVWAIAWWVWLREWVCGEKCDRKHECVEWEWWAPVGGGGVSQGRKMKSWRNGVQWDPGRKKTAFLSGLWAGVRTGRWQLPCIAGCQSTSATSPSGPALLSWFTGHSPASHYTVCYGWGQGDPGRGERESAVWVPGGPRWAPDPHPQPLLPPLGPALGTVHGWWWSEVGGLGERRTEWTHRDSGWGGWHRATTPMTCDQRCDRPFPL